MKEKMSFTDLENFIPMEYISVFRMEFRHPAELVVRKGCIVHLAVPKYVEVEFGEEELIIWTDGWYLALWLGMDAFMLDVDG